MLSFKVYSVLWIITYFLFYFSDCTALPNVVQQVSPTRLESNESRLEKQNIRYKQAYRPIALTSNVGKLMERLVNGRIMRFMEEKGLMTSYQSGFRKGRSTTDSIICLEDEIRKAQVKKETVRFFACFYY